MSNKGKKNKVDLRKFYKEKRSSLEPNIKKEKDLEIQSRFLLTDEYRKCKGILVYIARDFEIDTSGIINAAFANKKIVAVPKVNDDFSLCFYKINSKDDLLIGKFSVCEPKDGLEKITDFDDFVCVTPSLCCDLNGYRLGFGKGCYDRFFAKFEGKKIALTYSDSIEVAIDTDENDIKVDAIVTDSFTKYICEDTILSKEDNYE